MDICNFAKVILTRATKDISSLQWWKKQNSENNRPILTDNYQNNNSDDNSNTIQKSYTSIFSLMERHQNYMMFMDGYPKMHVEYDYFKKRISRLQSYLTEKKYWKSGGKSEEPITTAEHRQEIKKAVTVSKKKFEEVIKDYGNDVTNFLSSGKSFNQYHRDRMAGFYESKVRAEERIEKLIRQESAGKKKSKQHHGNFENYSFDRTGFLNEMTSKPSGSDINWTLMAKKYNLQINGKFPANAGQVILEYARKQGINTQTHNKEKRVSSRDYLRRIRRAKNTIYMRNKQHSLPTPRTGKATKEDVKRKLQSGELYIGVKIAEECIP
ncbi:unnamed protein product [Mytilus coruscus]|uniref:Uncharacterized protein n=1 Tax=Mytilus coruscus TaxID=42192 RepID=A0A6J7ZYM8_MYTCO|nr:unnamed protein product [Mytilus coruscus]